MSSRLVAVVLGLSLLSSPAFADEPPGDDLSEPRALEHVPGPTRPTSDQLSLFSGRTVGNGEVVLAAGAGWPGIFAELLLAPSSRFNLSIRGAFHWGSPIAGFGTGVGGELSFPMRLLLYAKGDVDFAAYARPHVIIAEGALVGQNGTFADDLGWGAGLEVGARVGYAASRSVTLATGLSVTGTYYDVPKGTNSNGFATTFGGMFALEGLLTRSTMLFFRAVAGYGVTKSGRFDSDRVLLQLAFGLAYRL